MMHVLMFILFVLLALVVSFMMTADGKRAPASSRPEPTDAAVQIVAAAIATAIWSEIERETEHREEALQVPAQEDRLPRRKVAPTRSPSP
ncbi:MAG: hypothetical protein ACRDGN_06710 [bacterium]